MNYLMIRRELETLGKDLMQMAEGIIGPEPPVTKPGEPAAGRMAKPKEEVKREIDYVSAKLEAVSLLIEGVQQSSTVER